jgi:hypothetical protein
VHRRNLLAASSVWGDMFEVANAQEEAVPVVELTETSDTLEYILQFIYPAPVKCRRLKFLAIGL